MWKNRCSNFLILIEIFIIWSLVIDVMFKICAGIRFAVTLNVYRAQACLYVPEPTCSKRIWRTTVYLTMKRCNHTGQRNRTSGVKCTRVWYGLLSVSMPLETQTGLVLLCDSTVSTTDTVCTLLQAWCYQLKAPITNDSQDQLWCIFVLREVVFQCCLYGDRSFCVCVFRI